MQAQGQTISMNQVITTDISTEISKVTPVEIKTTNMVDKMLMKQTMFGQELSYDSSDPSTYASGRAKLVGDALNKIIKKPYGITMDHLGNISAYDLSALLKGNNKISKVAGQSINLTGTQSGDVVVDTKTGWTMSSHMTQDIKMKIEKNGMEIPMDISSTITSTVEKK